MRRFLIVVALGASWAMADTGGDELRQAFADAGVEMQACTHAWARAYAMAKEPAADIATGAIAACAQTRKRLELQVVERTQLSPHQVMQTFDLAEKKLQADLLRAVIERRGAPSR